MIRTPRERIKELEDLLGDGRMYEPGDHPFDWYQMLAERPGEPGNGPRLAETGVQMEPVQVVVKHVKQAQEKLATAIESGSGVNADTLLNDLLGILDSQELVRAIRAIEER